MFLDLRKYFFANIISLIEYVAFVMLIIHMNTDFPPYQPLCCHEGPGLEPSLKEQVSFDRILVLYVLQFILFLFLFIEIMVRFLFKKFVRSKPFFVMPKFPKFVVVTYSILFYVGFFGYLAKFCWFFFQLFN